MNKFYITADKVGEFVAKMYEKGIRVDADPTKEELCVSLPHGKYEWIKVYRKGSFEELLDMFDQSNEN